MSDCPVGEIASFADLWKGGYLSGDPLDPMGRSDYGDMGYISVQHVTYQVCIRPFVGPQVAVVEIGPGRGAWTKTMLNAREVWCLDALSAEHNRFWEYIGRENQGKVKYFQVRDFSCEDLPDDYFDFLFSYGTFCHITWEGQCEYYKNLYAKMRPGANAMVMFADFDKYNAAILNSSRLRVRRVEGNIVLSGIKDILVCAKRSLGHLRNWRTRTEFELLDKNDSGRAAGRWYHAGIRETCQVLESLGWHVVNADVGVNHRDPIVHFRKPSV